MRISDWSSDVCSSDLGTYGVEAGAIRYFNHGASHLTRTEAARLAAVLPLPKKRAAIAPSRFTRRYGNSIARRIGVVQRDGLDACLKRDAHKKWPASIDAGHDTAPNYARQATPNSDQRRVGKACVSSSRNRCAPTTY